MTLIDQDGWLPFPVCSHSSSTLFLLRWLTLPAFDKLPSLKFLRGEALHPRPRVVAKYIFVKWMNKFVGKKICYRTVFSDTVGGTAMMEIWETKKIEQNKQDHGGKKQATGWPEASTQKLYCVTHSMELIDGSIRVYYMKNYFSIKNNHKLSFLIFFVVFQISRLPLKTRLCKSKH